MLHASALTEWTFAPRFLFQHELLLFCYVRLMLQIYMAWLMHGNKSVGKQKTIGNNKLGSNLSLHGYGSYLYIVCNKKKIAMCVRCVRYILAGSNNSARLISR